MSLRPEGCLCGGPAGSAVGAPLCSPEVHPLLAPTEMTPAAWLALRQSVLFVLKAKQASAVLTKLLAAKNPRLKSERVCEFDGCTPADILKAALEVKDVGTLPHKLLAKHNQFVLNKPGEVANIDFEALTTSPKIEERVAAVNAELSKQGLGAVVFSIKHFDDGKMTVIESQEAVDEAIMKGAAVKALVGSCNITATDGSERQTSFNECVPADDGTWQAATDTASVRLALPTPTRATADRKHAPPLRCRRVRSSIRCYVRRHTAS